MYGRAEEPPSRRQRCNASSKCLPLGWTSLFPFLVMSVNHLSVLCKGGPLDLALRWRTLEWVGCVNCPWCFFVLWWLELLEEERCLRRLRRGLLSRLWRLWWVEDEVLWE